MKKIKKNYVSDNSEENEEFSDIVEDRPILFQINRKREKLRKEENLRIMIKKRIRSDNKTDIIYDANKNILILENGNFIKNKVLF